MILTPKSSADSATISINDGRVYIDGTHYRFAYGYLSQRAGQYAIDVKNVLSAGYVKGRPKPALMGFIGCGLFIPVLQSICDKLWISDTIKDTGTAILAFGAVVCCLGYLFIRRDLFEIATSGYRICVKCKNYDKSDISAFRTLIYQSK